MILNNEKMEKKLLALALLTLQIGTMQSQVANGTVSIGAGYTNHKFYSLSNGETGTQSKDNWDIAFEITGNSGSILANTQRANFALYRAPYSIANYASLDTTGIVNWTTLYNSDQSWGIGAFNQTASSSNANDLGWGVYDQNTHYITGDSCYVIKISSTSYKKLKIISLISGTYTFEYANIDGTLPQTATIAKTTYTGKNFAFFDLANNLAVDREPLANDWDLMFGRYTAQLEMGPGATTPYPVVGVLTNKGVGIIQMNDVVNPEAYTEWPGLVFGSNISTIGHDWKSVDINTGNWQITGDTIYVIKDRTGNIWRLRFIGFSGSTNGNYIFSKTQLSAVGIADVKGATLAKVTVYPNPSSDNTALIFSSEESITNVSVSIIDVTGKIISTQILKVDAGLNQQQLNTASLNSGVYFISINAGSYVTTQKLIKQ